jgi:hypothetical protein
VLFRDGRGPDLPSSIVRWADVFARVLDAGNGVTAFAALIEYIFRVSQVPRKDLHRAIRTLGPVAEVTSMTIAEQLKREGKAEGRAEGKAEGRAEGKAELLLRQLSLRFGPLTGTVMDRVRTAATPEIEVWAERVLTAASLEAVFA